MIKPVAIVKVHPKPIRRYRGMRVLLARRNFKDFVGSSSYDGVIVVSPKFTKLSPPIQRRILEHEYQECRYFEKGAEALRERAHEFAKRTVGFPNESFEIRMGRRKKNDWFRDLFKGVA